MRPRNLQKKAYNNYEIFMKLSVKDQKKDYWKKKFDLKRKF